MTTRADWRARISAFALLGLLATATACTPNNQTNGPSTPPTATSTAPSSTTPTPTPSPTPTEVTEADKTAAIATFVKANEIIDDALINREPSFPKSLEQYLDPNSPFYKEQHDGLVESYTVGWHQTGRTTVTETAATAKTNGDIDLFVCIDATKVTINYPHLGPKPGAIFAGHIVATRTSCGWKLTEYGTPRIREVRSCNAGR